MRQETMRKHRTIAPQQSGILNPWQYYSNYYSCHKFRRDPTSGAESDRRHCNITCRKRALNQMILHRLLFLLVNG
jgi:hypothetical protein